jgi:DNA-binding GntR family transcriptional regulator
MVTSTRNAADRAYQQLKQAILADEFEPGAPLREERLATELGVSRTPVREALRRLGAEGLVVIDSNRGGRVPEWSEQDIEEIYAMRIYLESYAARRAAMTFTPEQGEKLDELLAQADTMAGVSTPAAEMEYAQRTLEFHRAIIAASGDRHLQTVYSSVVNLPILYRSRHRYSHDRLGQGLDEHRLLVRALRERDPEWAEAIMKQHILAARAEERRLMARAAATADSGK